MAEVGSAVAELTGDWLELALVDLAEARGALERHVGTRGWFAAHHAQQAAEKAMKAALVFAQIPHERTHDMSALGGLMPDWATRVRALAGLESLNPFAVRVRYPQPGNSNRITTWEQAAAAVALAGAVVAAVESDLSDAGYRELVRDQDPA